MSQTLLLVDHDVSINSTLRDSLPPHAYAALYQIAALATSESREDAAQHALNSALAALKVDHGYLLLLNPDTGRLEVEAQCGLSTGVAAPTFEMGQGLPGWVALHVQPVLSVEVAAESRYRPLRENTQCQMAAPMLIEENSLGVIVVDHEEIGGFSTQDLELLVILTDEITRVLRRIWLFDQLTDKARQLETLITIGHSLVGKLAPQELFDSLTRDTQQILNAQACALYLYEKSPDTLRCVSLSSSRDITINQAEHPTDECLIGGSVRTSRQTEYADIQSPGFLALADLPDDPALHSVLITPLVYENQVLGALVLFADPIQRFDNDTKRLTAGLASLGAVAMENARLYSRVFKSEDTLRKNEQLTTLGLLSAEIAHEIRNPLTVLKLLHGGLGLDFSSDDPRQTDMRVIGEKLDQLESIVTRVLQFGATPAANLHARWNFVDIINDTLVLLRLKFDQAKIAVHFTPPSQSPIIEGHQGQLQQVLLNLLLNSSHAMPDGGSITLNLETAESDQFSLDITDTGCGIPEELRERIFDSFLSGRPDGSGLGLAIARRVLLSHHGDIALIATGPEGTTLRITLPLAH